jgi:hypothetical protein
MPRAGRGPTGHIVEEEPGLFDRVAFLERLGGDDAHCAELHALLNHQNPRRLEQHHPAELSPPIGVSYVMPLLNDASHVRGSHGRLPVSQADTPLILCSSPDVPASVAGQVVADDGQVPAAAVKDLVLQLQGAPVPM